MHSRNDYFDGDNVDDADDDGDVGDYVYNGDDADDVDYAEDDHGPGSFSSHILGLGLVRA